jgi:hypothetical protein
MVLQITFPEILAVSADGADANVTVTSTGARTSSSGNFGHVTRKGLREVRARGREPERSEGGQADELSSAEEGVFYVVQLEPELDPGRFKVGFAASMPERLRQLRCSAPFARVVRSWPCRRLWERTAIDCASAGCERLHTEVFRAASLDPIVARCERFFAVMPPVSSPPP